MSGDIAMEGARDGACEAVAAVELDGVVAGYGGRRRGGGKPVLRGTTVRFPSGAASVVIGPNGCGKSTLVRCVALGMPVRAGKVSVLGSDVADLGNRARARLVAVMPQGVTAPDVEVEQFVAGGRYPHRGPFAAASAEDREIVRRALEQAGCSRFMGRSMRALSGGERQRVCLALVLAQQAKVAVLDEPTAYLDPAASFELMSVVRELRDRGVSVIAVLHDLPLAFSHADRIAVMRAGRVEAFGTPGEVGASGVVDEVFDLRLRRARCEGESAWCVLPRR